MPKAVSTPQLDWVVELIAQQPVGIGVGSFTKTLVGISGHTL